MVAQPTKKHPTVLWAQRDNVLYLTVEVEDMKIKELVVDGERFFISGSNEAGDVDYEAELELYAAIKGSERRQVATQRHVELVIPKEKVEWWPRLLKTPTKLPWLKVDFNKWLDEDDAAEAKDNDFDFSNLPGDFNFGGAGAGGAGAGAGDLGDLSSDDEEDADEKEDDSGDMPPLEDVEKVADKDVEPAKPESSSTA